MPTRSILTPLLVYYYVLTFWLRTRFLFSHNLVNNWSICSSRLISQAIFISLLSSSPSKLVWIVILAITLSPSYSNSSLLSRFYCHLHVPFHSPPLWTYIFVCSPSSSWIHVHISDHSHQQSPNKSLNQFTLNISTKAPFKQFETCI